MQEAQASSERSPHRKIDVTSKPPVGGISVVTLIRTDTTLDHSQKAEKVWRTVCGVWKPSIFACPYIRSHRRARTDMCSGQHLFPYLAGARASDRMEALRRSEGTRPYKNCLRHIDVSHSRQPLVKGERLMRTERKTATIPSRPVHYLATSCVAIYTATIGNTDHTRGSAAAREGLRLPPAARPCVRPKPT